VNSDDVTDGGGDDERASFFCLYAKPDRAWADRIYQALADAGYKVSRTPVAGDRWPDLLAEGLAGDRYLLLVLTRDAATRPRSITGISSAVAMSHREGRQRVVPVRINRCELPPELTHLTPIDLFGAGSDPRWRAQLLEQVAQLTGAPEPAVGPPPPPGPRPGPDDPPSPGRPGLMAAGIAASALAAAAGFAADLARLLPDGVAVAAMAVLALPGLLAMLAAAGGADTRSDAEALAMVRGVVHDEVGAEISRLRMRLYRLPVLGVPADPGLFDSWDELVAVAEDGRRLVRAGPEVWPNRPPGAFDVTRDLLGVLLDEVPTQRLVLLGEPGSGKSVALLFLVEMLLARWSPAEPLPFLIPLGAWDPTREGLEHWLTRWLIESYPRLGEPSQERPGKTRAQALLDDNRIMPLLDGLDEIAAASRADAVEAINTAFRAGQPLVVTARLAEYRELAQPESSSAVTVRGARGIVLRPLAPSAVVRYWNRWAGPGTAPAERWAELAEQVRSPGTAAAAVLATPLMVSLAARVYGSGSASRHPAELVGAGAATPESIRRRLFDRFVAVVYEPVTPEQPPPWDANRAHASLTFLAGWQADAVRGADLRWWDLHMALRPSAARGLFAALFGLVAGALGGSVLALAIEINNRAGSATTTGSRAGLMIALIAGTAGWYGSRVPPAAPAARPRWRSINPAWVAPPMVVGIALMPALAFLAGARPDGGLTRWLVIAVLGAIGGLLAGTALGVRSRPADVRRGSTPELLLRRDRMAFLSLASSTGTSACVVIGVTFGLTMARSSDTVIGIIVGLVTGVVGGFVVGATVGVTRAAWGWFTFTRVCLAVSGRLPWRLMPFLADARDRGVLRQRGVVYQFRHRDLRDHLAAQPTGPAPPAHRRSDWLVRLARNQVAEHGSLDGPPP